MGLEIGLISSFFLSVNALLSAKLADPLEEVTKTSQNVNVLAL